MHHLTASLARFALSLALPRMSGQAIAYAFANAGAKLVVCADIRVGTRDGKGTPTHQMICEKFGCNKAFFKMTDATVKTEVEALVQEAVKVGGRLDV